MHSRDVVEFTLFFLIKLQPATAFCKHFHPAFFMTTLASPDPIHQQREEGKDGEAPTLTIT